MIVFYSLGARGNAQIKKKKIFAGKNSWAGARLGIDYTV
jgi:hypothetical protein